MILKKIRLKIGRESGYPMIRILQVTDSHLLKNGSDHFLGLNVSSSFKAVINEVKKDVKNNSTDLIILSGDLSHDHSCESYQHIVNEISTLPCKVTYVPGNHDRAVVAEKILTTSSNFFLNKRVDFKHWQIILLNSYYHGHVSGYLDDLELSFLKRSLEEKIPQYKMIVLHHHIMPSERFWLDKTITKNKDEFLSRIKGYDHVRLVVCGHTHHDSMKRKDGVDFISTPSTSVQFANSKQFQLDPIMPGYRRINLYDDGQYSTEVIRIKENKNFIPDLSATGY